MKFSQNSLFGKMESKISVLSMTFLNHPKPFGMCLQILIYSTSSSLKVANENTNKKKVQGLAFNNNKNQKEKIT